MTFVLLDDASWSHPKALRAGNEAWGAFTRMLAYCSTHLTDGIIDSEVALSIAVRPRVIDKLVTVGLLERVGDTFRVHDYLEHNPSRSEVEAKRKAKTERQNRWRAKGESSEAARENTGKSARVDASTAPSTRRSTDASTDASKDAAPSHPIPSHPREEGGPRAPARTPPRAPAREETPPAPSVSEDQEALEEALLDGVDRTPGRWVDRGQPWQRAALLAELEDRGLDKLAALKLGRYLSTDTATEQERTGHFSFDWFVFGKPGAPEFKRLDGVLRRAEEWELARQPVTASTSAPKTKRSGRVLPPEEVSAKFRRAKSEQLAARPAAVEDSNVVPISDAIDEFLSSEEIKHGC